MEVDKRRKRKGFFKTLVTILLGTRKEYKVEDLGIFSSKVCDWWQNDHYNWFTTLQLPSYSAETVIAMDGDASSPSPQQLLELRALLKNWASITARLDSILPNESRLVHKEEIYASWQDHFYPEAINPSDKDNDGWEITFVREDMDDCFSFIWKNSTVRNLTFN